MREAWLDFWRHEAPRLGRRIVDAVAWVLTAVPGRPFPSSRDRSVQRRGRELIRLVSDRLPLEFDGTVVTDHWPLIGSALLSRMTTTLETVLDLQPERREADSATLTRSLYEHAVHFAWLAANPSPASIERWRKDDLVQRLRADDDATRHGFPVLTPNNRASFEKQVESMSGAPLVLADLAVAADKHWAGKLKGLQSHDQLMSLSGLYTLVYRSYSAIAHPSEIGLQRVTEEIGRGRQRVQIERPSTRSGPWGIAGVVYTIALLAASESLGWPDADAVYAIYERYT